MFHNFPYSDAHELNLDWFLNQFKDIKKMVKSAAGAPDATTAAAGQAPIADGAGGWAWGRPTAVNVPVSGFYNNETEEIVFENVSGTELFGVDVSGVNGPIADLKSTVNAIMNSDYFSFFDLACENGTLDNNGAEIADTGTNTRYRTAFIQPNSFETLVLFIPRYCYCYGYRYDSSKRFLGYVAGGWLGATANNQDGIVKIQHDGETTFYRFVFRALTNYTGAQRAMTSDDLANIYCFHI